MKHTSLILGSVGVLAACSPPSVSPAQKCLQTVLAYADLRDDPTKATEYGALFSYNGTFTLGPNTVTGRDAIIERHISANSAMRWNHVMDGDIEVSDDLKGQSRVIVYTTPLDGTDGQVTRFIVANYHDQFEMGVSNNCLIKARRVEVLFDSTAQ